MVKYPYVESLKHARFYREKLGFVVIPTAISDDGERVYPVKWGHYREKGQSVSEVMELFTKFRGANISVVLGRISGVVVIDVDKNEIPSYLQRVNTWVVTTRRGYHFYFRYPFDEPEGVRSMHLEEKVELKADGALATLPRSYHHKNQRFRYEWLVPPIKNMKKGIMHELADFSVVRDKLAIYYVKKREDEAIRELYKGVPEGKRNSSLARIAGSLFYDGLDLEEVITILLAVNRNNNPPLPEKEVISIAKSIYKRDLTRRRIYSELEDKLCRMIANNGVREGLLKHVEKIKQEMKKNGMTERDVVMVLKKISFYDVYRRIEKKEKGV